MLMANMREIAKKAGIGIATVSRYLNGTGYVSEEAGEKIQKVIDELNYTPNALARAVFTKNSKIIGLMVPNISNPFFTQMASVIEEYAQQRGYRIFLCNTDDNKDKEKNYLEVLQSHRVAGIIASRSQCKDEYVNIDIPVVAFENHILDNIITISSDNYNGGKMAFDHLYEKGCRKILQFLEFLLSFRCFYRNWRAALQTKVYCQHMALYPFQLELESFFSLSVQIV